MITIDDNTVVFKMGSTYYRNDFRGQGCSQLSRPGSRDGDEEPQRRQLCSGDIATINDTASGMMVGACSFGEFVPYRKV